MGHDRVAVDDPDDRGAGRLRKCRPRSYSLHREQEVRCLSGVLLGRLGGNPSNVGTPYCGHLWALLAAGILV